MLTITKNFPGLVEEKDRYVLKREIHVESEVSERDISINLDKTLYVEGITTSGNIHSNVDLYTPEKGYIRSTEGEIVCVGKITSGDVYARGKIKSLGITASGYIYSRGSLDIGGDIISRGEIFASDSIRANGGMVYGLQGIIAGQNGITSSGSIGSEGKIQSLGAIHSMGGGLYGLGIESLDFIRSEESIHASVLIQGKSISARGDIAVLHGSILSMRNISCGGDLSVKKDIMAGINPPDPEMKEKIPDNLDFDQIVCRKLLSGRILRGKLEEESVQDSISAGNKSKGKKQTSPSCS